MPTPFLHRKIAGITISLLVLAGTAARGTLADPNFTDTQFANNNTSLNQMTGIGWAPDGSNRLFVIRKGGQVMIIQNGAIVATPFATLSPVYTNSECGLVGFTFDPGFASNGHIYFFVTVSSSEQRILRYTAVGNTGTAATSIMSGLPTAGNNHDGGGIGIGPDGKLYWSIGDLGNGTGVDANLSSLAAKVGRANRDGSVPQGNPFIDGAGPNNDYIWARGVRNPFTMAFQPGSGKLWLNVVGTGYEQVFVVTKGSHAGYNDYENNQPAGHLTPVIKYRTNGADTRTISASGGTSRNSNVATFTTTGMHGFRKGEKITISGVPDASFNGAFFVVSVPSATTFTVAQTGPNASSGGGTAATQNQGGCLSGGAFWDSTAAPPAYRGNFFYGDYNSGRMMRAILNASDEVTSVDSFSTSSGHLASYIDTAIGPDGAIYYGSFGNGQIRRAAFTASAQGLIVTPTFSQTDEGQRTAFSVKLATAPSANVTVSVSRSSEETDLNVVAGASLTFTPANFATPQAVMLEASEDSDAINDEADFTVASAGLASQTVNLKVLDNEITPLDGWKLAKFSQSELSDPAISGNDADPENDGFTNLMEYALGMEPKQHANPAELPGVIMESVNGTSYLALRYRRPLNGRPDLLYKVQVSGDLSTWTSGPAATTTVSTTPNGDGTETVVVRDNLPVSSENQRFIRLQVPPP